MKDVKYPTQKHTTTQDSNESSPSLSSRKFLQWKVR